MPNKAAETGAICILTSDVILLLQKVEIKTKTLRNLCISCNFAQTSLSCFSCITPSHKILFKIVLELTLLL